MTWRTDAGLAGRSVVVTGAAGGIGRALADALADAGAIVVAVDLPSAPVREVVAALPGDGHRCVEADLTDLGGHEGIFEQAAAAAPLVGLVHAAAVIVRRTHVDEVTEDDFDRQVEVNLRSTFFLNRSCWRALRGTGGGSIVNFASQGWWTGGFGGSVVYSATKGAVVSMSRGLARTFAPDGVRVNVVAPGMVDTAMMREGLTDEARTAMVDMVPMGRMAGPEEMAGAAVFLLSDASSYVTGAVLNVSGGQLMY